MSQDKIGTDQWVSSYQERLVTPSGWTGMLRHAIERLPLWGRMTLLIILGLLIPVLTDNTYIIRIAGTIALMATLAMGLNLVVGYAGMLDLGFVAFYGIGGYAYAYLSSDFTELHWPTWASLIVITLLAAVFGLLLGSPSLRLIGDYLAIVTLGFGQIFVQLTTSMTRVNLPGLERPVNLTGGPNGIVSLDPVRFFDWTASTVRDYYFLLFIALILIVVFVYHLNQSRLGRAWRALREDELAAGAMGIPTRRLKLQAFAIGAAIAGLSGALFAAWQGSVFPSNFDITLLITLYAIIVLGGLGSLPGVLVASVIMIAVPEILRDVRTAGMIFYAGVVIILFTALKPRWQFIPLLVALGLFGIALRAILVASSPDMFAEAAPATLSLSTASIGDVISSYMQYFLAVIRNWLAIPIQSTNAGNLAFAALIVMVLLVSRLKRTLWRFTILIPTLYLLAFAWETRLSQEPSVTRLIFVGILLVVLMIYRPNGLLGQKRVDVV